MLLNQTIVSDIARLHLDFILCDDSLHRPLMTITDDLESSSLSMMR